jgi:membrane protein
LQDSPPGNSPEEPVMTRRSLTEDAQEVFRAIALIELGARMQVDVLQLEPVLQALVQLDWIGRLNELEDQDGTRYVMLADARSTSLEPLMRALLLPVNVATAKMWESGRLSSLYLSDVL